MTEWTQYISQQIKVWLHCWGIGLYQSPDQIFEAPGHVQKWLISAMTLQSLGWKLQTSCWVLLNSWNVSGIFFVSINTNTDFVIHPSIHILISLQWILGKVKAKCIKEQLLFFLNTFVDFHASKGIEGYDHATSQKRGWIWPKALSGVRDLVPQQIIVDLQSPVLMPN